VVVDETDTVPAVVILRKDGVMSVVWAASE
jgi:hypothetical protein